MFSTFAFGTLTSGRQSGRPCSSAWTAPEWRWRRRPVAPRTLRRRSRRRRRRRRTCGRRRQPWLRLRRPGIDAASASAELVAAPVDDEGCDEILPVAAEELPALDVVVAASGADSTAFAASTSEESFFSCFLTGSLKVGVAPCRVGAGAEGAGGIPKSRRRGDCNLRGGGLRGRAARAGEDDDAGDDRRDARSPSRPSARPGRGC